MSQLAIPSDRLEGSLQTPDGRELVSGHVPSDLLGPRGEVGIAQASAQWIGGLGLSEAHRAPGVLNELDEANRTEERMSDDSVAPVVEDGATIAILQGHVSGAEVLMDDRWCDRSSLQCSVELAH